MWLLCVSVCAYGLVTRRRFKASVATVMTSTVPMTMVCQYEVDTQQVQSVEDERHQRDAEQRAEDGTFAAGQAGATDDHAEITCRSTPAGGDGSGAKRAVKSKPASAASTPMRM